MQLYAYVHDSNSWIAPLGVSGKQKVFWSGGKRAQNAARAYTEKIEGEILEKTPQAKALERWTTDLDRETQSKPLCEKFEKPILEKKGVTTEGVNKNTKN